MKHYLERYDFPQWSFALYFLAILPEGETGPEPGTQESEDYLWTMKGTCLELTHNYGTENDPEYKVLMSSRNLQLVSFIYVNVRSTMVM